MKIEWFGLILSSWILLSFSTFTNFGKDYETSDKSKYQIAVRNGFFKWSDFDGKASRSEFWYFFLYTFWVSLAFQLIDYLTFLTSSIEGSKVDFWDSWILSTVFTIIIFIPTIAVGARRLHAIGKSGWWQLISLTIIGIIPLIIWLGQKDSNLIKSKKGNLSNELKEIKELYKDGTLTKAEFEKAKNKLLK